MAREGGRKNCFIGCGRVVKAQLDRKTAPPATKALPVRDLKSIRMYLLVRQFNRNITVRVKRALFYWVIIVPGTPPGGPPWQLGEVTL